MKKSFVLFCGFLVCGVSAVVAAALLTMTNRGTWIARFSYFVASGDGQP